MNVLAALVIEMPGDAGKTHTGFSRQLDSMPAWTIARACRLRDQAAGGHCFWFQGNALK